MGNICSNQLPGGINSNCDYMMSPIRNIVIVEKDSAGMSDANIVNLSQWQTKIKQSLTAFVPAGLASYDRTTDDPQIQTNPFGRKFVSRQGVPSMVAYFESNVCDYNELKRTLKGGTYQVFFIMEDNNIMAWKKSDGLNYGFTANIVATGSDIPLMDTIENSFPVYINFRNSEEFETRAMYDPIAWNPNIDLPANMPLGLNMVITTAYSSGDVIVKITERCGDLFDDDGLTTTDFQVIASNDLSVPAVTAVDTTDHATGIYVLTLQKGSSPANLSAGDYMIIRVKNMDGSNVTHVSNRLVVNA